MSLTPLLEDVPRCAKRSLFKIGTKENSKKLNPKLKERFLFPSLSVLVSQLMHTLMLGAFLCELLFWKLLFLVVKQTVRQAHPRSEPQKITVTRQCTSDAAMLLSAMLQRTTMAR